MPESLPIPRATLEELTAHRERALALYQQAAEIISEAYAVTSLACPGNHCPHPSRYELELLSNYRRGDFMGAVRKKLDAAMWRDMIERTALGELMDATAKRELEENLERGKIPEATFENVSATLMTLAGSTQLMIRRGVAELFAKLCGRYRTNRAFKVEKKIIMTRMVTEASCFGGMQFFDYGGASDQLVDLERTLHVVDGQHPPDRAAAIDSRIRAQIRTKGAPSVVETPYLRVQWFKNGNGHVWILREDLLPRINKLIAEHFGEVMPDARGRKS